MTHPEALSELDRLLQSPGEHEVLEFKTAADEFDFDKLGKYFSALSNEANLVRQERAWLVLGVEPKKHLVVGTRFKHSWQKLNALKKGLADKTTDRITFLGIHEVEKNGKRVLMFEIPPAPKGMPVAFEGHHYGREHESLVPLNTEKFERIRAQQVQPDWTAEVVPEATIHDLDPAAIAKARENYRQKYPDKAAEMDAQEWGDLTFLNKAKLIRQGRITRAALILLGREESEHFLPTEVKIRWKLKNAAGEDLDHLIVPIPLLLGVDRVYQKIRNLKYRYMRDPGSIFPEEVDMYEPFTIREAINNCIAHQDYTISGRINVIELPDQLVFTNRGRFIPGTVERAVIDNAPEEVYRNPFLATAMLNLKMVDTAGGGIRKMFQYQRDRLFPMPEYDLSNDRVEVRVTGKVLDLDFARILSRDRSLSLEEIIMLDKVQKRKPLTKDEAAQLRARKLIEGRRPNYFFSLGIASQLGQKAEYTRNMGLDKNLYIEYLKKCIRSHRELNRKEVNELLIRMMPNNLNEKQKITKVTNLLSELRSKGVIRNIGTRAEPRWVLVQPPKPGKT